MNARQKLVTLWWMLLRVVAMHFYRMIVFVTYRRL